MNKPAEKTDQGSVVDQDVVMPVDLENQITKAKKQNQYLNKLMDELLEEGVDYDTHSGIPKPFLHQEGAQQLARVFKFSTKMKKTDYEIDLDREPNFVKYEYRCELYSRQNGEYVGDGVGSCNNYERKYRYSKDGSEQEDLAGKQNTVQKMAKKRAFVDAILNVTGANRIFTQDRDIVAEYEDKSNPANADNPGEVVVDFGKHSGSTLTEIKKNDKSYVEWLAENANSGQMRKAAKQVLQGNNENQRNSQGNNSSNNEKQQIVNEIAEQADKETVEEKMEQITDGKYSEIDDIKNLDISQLKTIKSLTVTMDPEVVEEDDVAAEMAEKID